jgi:hypothetical protein
MGEPMKKKETLPSSGFHQNKTSGQLRFPGSCILLGWRQLRRTRPCAGRSGSATGTTDFRAGIKHPDEV